MKANKGSNHLALDQKPETNSLLLKSRKVVSSQHIEPRMNLKDQNIQKIKAELLKKQ